jgi:hypothetical protein
VIRWIDYWDGRHFGAELTAKVRTPAGNFPTDFKESTAPDNAAPTSHDHYEETIYGINQGRSLNR